MAGGGSTPRTVENKKTAGLRVGGGVFRPSLQGVARDGSTVGFYAGPQFREELRREDFCD